MKRIFEFRCVKDHITEKLVDDEVRSVECPHCHNEASRIISSPRIAWRASQVHFLQQRINGLENTSKQQESTKRETKVDPVGIFNFLESIVDRRIMWQRSSNRKRKL